MAHSVLTPKLQGLCNKSYFTCVYGKQQRLTIVCSSVYK